MKKKLMILTVLVTLFLLPSFGLGDFEPKQNPEKQDLVVGYHKVKTYTDTLNLKSILILHNSLGDSVDIYPFSYIVVKEKGFIVMRNGTKKDCYLTTSGLYWIFKEDVEGENIFLTYWLLLVEKIGLKFIIIFILILIFLFFIIYIYKKKKKKKEIKLFVEREPESVDEKIDGDENFDEDDLEDDETQFPNPSKKSQSKYSRQTKIDERTVILQKMKSEIALIKKQFARAIKIMLPFLIVFIGAIFGTLWNFRDKEINFPFVGTILCKNILNWIFNEILLNWITLVFFIMLVIIIAYRYYSSLKMSGRHEIMRSAQNTDAYRPYRVRVRMQCMEEFMEHFLVDIMGIIAKTSLYFFFILVIYMIGYPFLIKNTHFPDWIWINTIFLSIFIPTILFFVRIAKKTFNNAIVLLRFVFVDLEIQTITAKEGLGGR